MKHGIYKKFMIAPKIQLYDREYEPQNMQLDVEGREYKPQHRTIKTSLGSKYYSFPSLQFNKYSYHCFGDKSGNLKYHPNNNSYFFYQVSTILDDGTLGTIDLPNIAGGIVCLGEATGNSFRTKISLTLDEFVDLFWFTRFNQNAALPGFKFNLNDQIMTFSISHNGYPSLWMDEKYNLDRGWEKE